MESLERILKEHPFFASFPPEHLQLVTGCARNHRFKAGEYLFHEGDQADEFFLVRDGRIHMARAVARRAERGIAALAEPAPPDVVLAYLNRLSDLLFILARQADQSQGRSDETLHA